MPFTGPDLEAPYAEKDKRDMDFEKLCDKKHYDFIYQLAKSADEACELTWKYDTEVIGMMFHAIAKAVRQCEVEEKHEVIGRVVEAIFEDEVWKWAEMEAEKEVSL